MFIIYLIAVIILLATGLSRWQQEQRREDKNKTAGNVLPERSLPAFDAKAKMILKAAAGKLVHRVPAEPPIQRSRRPGEGAQARVRPQRTALIPAGDFLMDIFQDEGGPDGPSRKVYLEAFYIDKTEVTVGQYKAFAEATGRKTANRLPDWSTDTHPAVYVEWEDADAYCKWAGGRLPTEAEWEKAARGGTDEEYDFQTDRNRLDEYAWYDGNSQSQAHGAGLKRANRYGLYDIHGNVWEWVAGGGPRHYTRGGGWSSSPDNLLRRYWHFPGYKNYDLGFRCVVPVDTRTHRI